MLELTELLKAVHFLFFFALILCLSIWIKEEFITIFSRKKIAGFGLLKVLIIKALSEENGYHHAIGRNLFEGRSLYFLSLMGGIAPLFFFQLTDTQTFLGVDFNLGLVKTADSWLYIFYTLLLGELIRGFYEREFLKTSIKLPLLILLLLTFHESIPTFSIEQFIQYQKSFGEFGIRNYLLFKNPMGLIFITLILYQEIKNPNEGFTLLNNLYLNIYILIFVFGFLGGYGLPSILSEQNFAMGSKILVFQSISLLAKYFFCLILIWVFKYSIIKESRRMAYGS